MEKIVGPYVGIIVLLGIGVLLTVLTIRITRMRSWGARMYLFRIFGLLWFFYIGIWFIVFNSTKNNLSGCTFNLLNAFKAKPLASYYVSEFSQQLKSEGYKIDYGRWEINSRKDGCIIQWKVYVDNPSDGKRLQISGDEFHINPNTKIVIGYSEGARLVLEYYGGSISLAENSKNPPSTGRTTQPQNSHTQVVNIPRASSVKIPIPPGCLLWSRISAKHSGQEVCAYGTLKNVYFYEHNQRWVLEFSDEIGSFQIWFFAPINWTMPKSGKCVVVNGAIGTSSSGRPIISIQSRNSKFLNFYPTACQ